MSNFDNINMALNFELQLPDRLPDWLPLIPAGNFVGRDGRTWVNDYPEGVVAAFNASRRDVVFDINHSTELKGPKGEDSPAVGFIRQLEDRDGAVWGRVEWNSDGKTAVLLKHYRYYSPAFAFDKDTGRVVSISSVGLTNKHNLFELPALNIQTFSVQPVSAEFQRINDVFGNTMEDHAKHSGASAMNQQQLADANYAEKIALMFGNTKGDIEKYGH